MVFNVLLVQSEVLTDQKVSRLYFFRQCLCALMCL